MAFQAEESEGLKKNSSSIAGIKIKQEPVEHTTDSRSRYSAFIKEKLSETPDKCVQRVDRKRQYSSSSSDSGRKSFGEILTALTEQLKMEQNSVGDDKSGGKTVGNSVAVSDVRIVKVKTEMESDVSSKPMIEKFNAKSVQSEKSPLKKRKSSCDNLKESELGGDRQKSSEGLKQVDKRTTERLPKNTLKGTQSNSQLEKNSSNSGTSVHGCPSHKQTFTKSTHKLDSLNLELCSPLSPIDQSVKSAMNKDKPSDRTDKMRSKSDVEKMKRGSKSDKLKVKKGSKSDLLNVTKDQEKHSNDRKEKSNIDTKMRKYSRKETHLSRQEIQKNEAEKVFSSMQIGFSMKEVKHLGRIPKRTGSTEVPNVTKHSKSIGKTRNTSSSSSPCSDNTSATATISDQTEKLAIPTKKFDSPAISSNTKGSNTPSKSRRKLTPPKPYLSPNLEKLVRDLCSPVRVHLERIDIHKKSKSDSETMSSKEMSQSDESLHESVKSAGTHEYARVTENSMPGQLNRECRGSDDTGAPKLIKNDNTGMTKFANCEAAADDTYKTEPTKGSKGDNIDDADAKSAYGDDYDEYDYRNGLGIPIMSERGDIGLDLIDKMSDSESVQRMIMSAVADRRSGTGRRLQDPVEKKRGNDSWLSAVMVKGKEDRIPGLGDLEEIGKLDVLCKKKDLCERTVVKSSMGFRVAVSGYEVKTNLGKKNLQIEDIVTTALHCTYTFCPLMSEREAYLCSVVDIVLHQITSNKLGRKVTRVENTCRNTNYMIEINQEIQPKARECSKESIHAVGTDPNVDKVSSELMNIICKKIVPEPANRSVLDDVLEHESKVTKAAEKFGLGSKSDKSKETLFHCEKSTESKISEIENGEAKNVINSERPKTVTAQTNVSQAVRNKPSKPNEVSELEVSAKDKHSSLKGTLQRLPEMKIDKARDSTNKKEKQGPKEGSDTLIEVVKKTDTQNQEKVVGQKENSQARSRRKPESVEKLLQKALTQVEIDTKTSQSSDASRKIPSTCIESRLKNLASKTVTSEVTRVEKRQARQYHPYRKESKPIDKSIPAWSFDIAYRDMHDLLQNMTENEFLKQGLKRADVSCWRNSLGRLNWSSPKGLVGRFQGFRFARCAVPRTLPQLSRETDEEEDCVIMPEEIPNLEERRLQADLVEEMFNEDVSIEKPSPDNTKADDPVGHPIMPRSLVIPGGMKTTTYSGTLIDETNEASCELAYSDKASRIEIIDLTDSDNFLPEQAIERHNSESLSVAGSAMHREKSVTSMSKAQLSKDENKLGKNPKGEQENDHRDDKKRKTDKKDDNKYGEKKKDNKKDRKDLKPDKKEGNDQRGDKHFEKGLEDSRKKRNEQRDNAKGEKIVTVDTKQRKDHKGDKKERKDHKDDKKHQKDHKDDKKHQKDHKDDKTQRKDHKDDKKHQKDHKDDKTQRKDHKDDKKHQKDHKDDKKQRKDRKDVQKHEKDRKEDKKHEKDLKHDKKTRKDHKDDKKGEKDKKYLDRYRKDKKDDINVEKDLKDDKKRKDYTDDTKYRKDRNIQESDATEVQMGLAIEETNDDHLPHPGKEKIGKNDISVESVSKVDRGSSTDVHADSGFNDTKYDFRHQSSHSDLKENAESVSVNSNKSITYTEGEGIALESNGQNTSLSVQKDEADVLTESSNSVENLHKKVEECKSNAAFKDTCAYSKSKADLSSIESKVIQMDNATVKQSVKETCIFSSESDECLDWNDEDTALDNASHVQEDANDKQIKACDNTDLMADDTKDITDSNECYITLDAIGEVDADCTIISISSSVSGIEISETETIDATGNTNGFDKLVDEVLNDGSIVEISDADENVSEKEENHEVLSQRIGTSKDDNIENDSSHSLTLQKSSEYNQCHVDFDADVDDTKQPIAENEKSKKPEIENGQEKETGHVNKCGKTEKTVDENVQKKSPSNNNCLLMGEFEKKLKSNIDSADISNVCCEKESVEFAAHKNEDVEKRKVSQTEQEENEHGSTPNNADTGNATNEMASRKEKLSQENQTTKEYSCTHSVELSTENQTYPSVSLTSKENPAHLETFKANNCKENCVPSPVNRSPITDTLHSNNSTGIIHQPNVCNEPSICKNSNIESEIQQAASSQKGIGLKYSDRVPESDGRSQSWFLQSSATGVQTNDSHRTQTTAHQMQANQFSGSDQSAHYTVPNMPTSFRLPYSNQFNFNPYPHYNVNNEGTYPWHNQFHPTNAANSFVQSSILYNAQARFRTSFPWLSINLNSSNNQMHPLQNRTSSLGPFPYTFDSQGPCPQRTSLLAPVPQRTSSLGPGLQRTSFMGPGPQGTSFMRPGSCTSVPHVTSSLGPGPQGTSFMGPGSCAPNPLSSVRGPGPCNSFEVGSGSGNNSQSQNSLENFRYTSSFFNYVVHGSRRLETPVTHYLPSFRYPHLQKNSPGSVPSKQDLSESLFDQSSSEHIDQTTQNRIHDEQDSQLQKTRPALINRPRSIGEHSKCISVSFSESEDVIKNNTCTFANSNNETFEVPALTDKQKLEKADDTAESKETKKSSLETDTVHDREINDFNRDMTKLDVQEDIHASNSDAKEELEDAQSTENLVSILIEDFTDCAQSARSENESQNITDITDQLEGSKFEKMATLPTTSDHDEKLCQNKSHVMSTNKNQLISGIDISIGMLQSSCNKTIPDIYRPIALSEDTSETRTNPVMNTGCSDIHMNSKGSLAFICSQDQTEDSDQFAKDRSDNESRHSMNITDETEDDMFEKIAASDDHEKMCHNKAEFMSTDENASGVGMMHSNNDNVLLDLRNDSTPCDDHHIDTSTESTNNTSPMIEPDTNSCTNIAGIHVNSIGLLELMKKDNAKSKTVFDAEIETFYKEITELEAQEDSPSTNTLVAILSEEIVNVSQCKEQMCDKSENEYCIDVKTIAHIENGKNVKKTKPSSDDVDECTGFQQEWEHDNEDVNSLCPRLKPSFQEDSSAESTDIASPGHNVLLKLRNESRSSDDQNIDTNTESVDIATPVSKPETNNCNSMSGMHINSKISLAVVNSKYQNEYSLEFAEDGSDKESQHVMNITDRIEDDKFEKMATSSDQTEKIGHNKSEPVLKNESLLIPGNVSSVGMMQSKGHNVLLELRNDSTTCEGQHIDTESTDIATPVREPGANTPCNDQNIEPQKDGKSCIQSCQIGRNDQTKTRHLPKTIITCKKVIQQEDVGLLQKKTIISEHSADNYRPFVLSEVTCETHSNRVMITGFDGYQNRVENLEQKLPLLSENQKLNKSENCTESKEVHKCSAETKTVLDGEIEKFYREITELEVQDGSDIESQHVMKITDQIEDDKFEKMATSSDQTEKICHNKSKPVLKNESLLIPGNVSSVGMMQSNGHNVLLELRNDSTTCEGQHIDTESTDIATPVREPGANTPCNDQNIEPQKDGKSCIQSCQIGRNDQTNTCALPNTTITDKKVMQQEDVGLLQKKTFISEHLAEIYRPLVLSEVTCETHSNRVMNTGFDGHQYVVENLEQKFPLLTENQKLNKSENCTESKEVEKSNVEPKTVLDGEIEKFYKEITELEAQEDSHVCRPDAKEEIIDAPSTDAVVSILSEEMENITQCKEHVYEKSETEYHMVVKTRTPIGNGKKVKKTKPLSDDVDECKDYKQEWEHENNDMNSLYASHKASFEEDTNAESNDIATPGHNMLLGNDSRSCDAQNIDTNTESADIATHVSKPETNNCSSTSGIHINSKGSLALICSQYQNVDSGEFADIESQHVLNITDQMENSNIEKMTTSSDHAKISLNKPKVMSENVHNVLHRNDSKSCDVQQIDTSVEYTDIATPVTAPEMNNCNSTLDIDNNLKGSLALIGSLYQNEGSSSCDSVMSHHSHAGSAITVVSFKGTINKESKKLAEDDSNNEEDIGKNCFDSSVEQIFQDCKWSTVDASDTLTTDTIDQDELDTVEKSFLERLEQTSYIDTTTDERTPSKDENIGHSCSSSSISSGSYSSDDEAEMFDAFIDNSAIVKMKELQSTCTANASPDPHLQSRSINAPSNERYSGAEDCESPHRYELLPHHITSHRRLSIESDMSKHNSRYESFWNNTCLQSQSDNQQTCHCERPLCRTWYSSKLDDYSESKSYTSIQEVNMKGPRSVSSSVFTDNEECKSTIDGTPDNESKHRSKLCNSINNSRASSSSSVESRPRTVASKKGTRYKSKSKCSWSRSSSKSVSRGSNKSRSRSRSSLRPYHRYRSRSNSSTMSYRYRSTSRSSSRSCYRYRSRSRDSSRPHRKRSRSRSSSSSCSTGRSRSRSSSQPYYRQRSRYTSSSRPSFKNRSRSRSSSRLYYRDKSRSRSSRLCSRDRSRSRSSSRLYYRDMSRSRSSSRLCSRDRSRSRCSSQPFSKHRSRSRSSSRPCYRTRSRSRSSSRPYYRTRSRSRSSSRPCNRTRSRSRSSSRPCYRTRSRSRSSSRPCFRTRSRSRSSSKKYVRYTSSDNDSAACITRNQPNANKTRNDSDYLYQNDSDYLYPCATDWSLHNSRNQYSDVTPKLTSSLDLKSYVGRTDIGPRANAVVEVQMTDRHSTADSSVDKKIFLMSSVLEKLKPDDFEHLLQNLKHHSASGCRWKLVLTPSQMSRLWHMLWESHSSVQSTLFHDLLEVQQGNDLESISHDNLTPDPGTRVDYVIDGNYGDPFEITVNSLLHQYLCQRAATDKAAYPNTKVVISPPSLIL